EPATIGAIISDVFSQKPTRYPSVPVSTQDDNPQTGSTAPVPPGEVGSRPMPQASQEGRRTTLLDIILGQ
ncbi:MAG: hypothetical protein ACOH2J_20235, partial [Allorhizobium sp.]